MWYFLSLSLEISIQLIFFQFLLPSSCSIVVCAVFGHLNYSCFALFYVVFEFLHWCIDSIFNAGESSSTFLIHKSLSLSFLGCKTLCIIISFLVLWSSLINFKNGPKYLTGGTAQVFIPLMRFLLHSLVLSSFLVLWRYSFLFLFYLSTF